MNNPGNTQVENAERDEDGGAQDSGMPRRTRRWIWMGTWSWGWRWGGTTVPHMTDKRSKAK